MKQPFKNLLILIAIIFLSICVSSQTLTANSWTPDRGYWVVEQNIHDELHHIVRFYNDDHQLIYTETVDNVRMDAEKKKTKVRLKRALEESLARWEKNRSPEANKGYVVAVLK